MGEGNENNNGSNYSELTNDELRKELEKRDIEYSSRANKDDLVELLELDDKGELEDADSGKDEDADTDGGAKGSSYDIIKGKEVVRTYSVKIHGKEAKKLAESYVKGRALKHNEKLTIRANK